MLKQVCFVRCVAFINSMEDSKLQRYCLYYTSRALTVDLTVDDGRETMPSVKIR